MTRQHDPHCLSIGLVARRWACDVGYVASLLKTGELQGFVLPPCGSRRRPARRIPMAAVLAFEESHTITPVKPEKPRPRSRSNGAIQLRHPLSPEILDDA